MSAAPRGTCASSASAGTCCRCCILECTPAAHHSCVLPKSPLARSSNSPTREHWYVVPRHSSRLATDSLGLSEEATHASAPSMSLSLRRNRWAWVFVGAVISSQSNRYQLCIIPRGNDQREPTPPPRPRRGNDQRDPTPPPRPRRPAQPAQPRPQLVIRPSSGYYVSSATLGRGLFLLSTVMGLYGRRIKSYRQCALAHRSTVL